MKLRVGLIGLGDAWESRHRPALRALGDRFEVRAVCTGVSALAEPVAREFNALTVDGFRALSVRRDVDAVLLLAPDWFGPLPILAACEAGKAVYCTSALDIEPHRAGEIRNRVEQSGVAFMAEFPCRQAPATIRLKELIATRLGQPQLVFCHERFSQPRTNGRPTAAPPSPTRTLMELVDWCCYVIDREPTHVTGVRHQGGNGGKPTDYQMMSLDFSPDSTPGRGPMAQISCGDYLPPVWHEATAFRKPAEMQVCCERGVAFIDRPSSVVWFDEAGRHHESLETERPVGEQLLTQFHRAVTSLIRKICDLDDACRALRIVNAAHTSSRDGARLNLD